MINKTVRCLYNTMDMMKKVEFNIPYKAPAIKICVLRRRRSVCAASPNQPIKMGERGYDDNDFEE